MRREGFELLIGPPKVITKTMDGKTYEPFETVEVQVCNMRLSWFPVACLGDVFGRFCRYFTCVHLYHELRCMLKYFALDNVASSLFFFFGSYNYRPLYFCCTFDPCEGTRRTHGVGG